MSERTPPPAGWYDDPKLVNTRRYWDGTQWTEHRQEKPAGPATAPAPVASGASSGGGIPKWVISGFGIVLAILAIWIFFGNGLATITGGTTVDTDDIASTIELDLQTKGIALDSDGLDCDDPGRVQRGDRTFCRGTADDGTPVTIQVTFQSDGGYVWEAR